MKQSQENFRTEGRKDRRTDPNSLDLSGHNHWSKKTGYIMNKTIQLPVGCKESFGAGFPLARKSDRMILLHFSEFPC